MFEYKMRSKQTLWNRAWPETRLGRVRVQTFWPNTQLPPIGIRAKIWAYTWVSEKFGHSNAKTQKTGHSYTFFIKKRGFIPGGAEKGGYSGAYPYYVLHRGLPPPPPPPRECLKGRSKIMQTVALQCLLKVKQDLC